MRTDDDQTERRADLRQWQRHVDKRLDAQDNKLDELLGAFRTSKWVVSAIAWLSGLGAALAVMWHNLIAK